MFCSKLKWLKVCISCCGEWEIENSFPKIIIDWLCVRKILYPGFFCLWGYVDTFLDVSSMWFKKLPLTSKISFRYKIPLSMNCLLYRYALFIFKLSFNLFPYVQLFVVVFVQVPTIHLTFFLKSNFYLMNHLSVHTIPMETFWLSFIDIKECNILALLHCWIYSVLLSFFSVRHTRPLSVPSVNSILLVHSLGQ